MEATNNVRHATRWRAEQLVMYAAGGLLMLSGIIHLLVWQVDGSSLSGPISWRKPILFGFSTGVTVISLGWLVGKFRRRTGDFFLLTMFSVAMLIEVGLITLQTWRGVASHFNRSTPFDSRVLTWIEVLIIFATLVIFELTRRSFGGLATRRDMALAIRGGMALLVLACLLGFVLVIYGNSRVSLGQPPELFGAAGVMKFPHGMPIHAIQYLPVMSWLLRKVGVAEHQRLIGVTGGLASLVAFTVFSLLQTFSGRGRFEWWWVSGIFLVFSLSLFAIPSWLFLTHALRVSFSRDS